MDRIEYKGYFIDKTKTGYRISRADNSAHTHLSNLQPSYKLIDNIIDKRIPKRCGLYYLLSHIRLTDDENYKRKLNDYYNMRVSKGEKQLYINIHKKKF